MQQNAASDQGLLYLPYIQQYFRHIKKKWTFSSFWTSIIWSYGVPVLRVNMICSIYSNLANAVFKFFVWMKTGSPSMFSEFMHSTGDTANQVSL